MTTLEKLLDVELEKNDEFSSRVEDYFARRAKNAPFREPCKCDSCRNYAFLLGAIAGLQCAAQFEDKRDVAKAVDVIRDKILQNNDEVAEKATQLGKKHPDVFRALFRDIIQRAKRKDQESSQAAEPEPASPSSFNAQPQAPAESPTASPSEPPQVDRTKGIECKLVVGGLTEAERNQINDLFERFSEDAKAIVEAGSNQGA